MTDHNCILCDAPLTPTTKPEHVWLQSGGGRMKSRRIYCDDCNAKMGNGPDAELAENMRFIRMLMNFPDGKGRPPPAYRGHHVGEQPVKLDPGGIPSLDGGKPFSITNLPDGRQEIEIRVGSEDPEGDIERLIPNIAGVLGASEAEVRQMLANGQFERRTERIGRQHVALTFGGPQAMRSMLKTCLSLWALRHLGHGELLKPGYAKARDIVRHGCDDLSMKLGALAPGVFAVPTEFTEPFGPNYNFACVASDANGRVTGYFRLYNFCAWRFVLCESEGAPNAVSGLIFDPANPTNWQKVTEADPVTYEMLDRAGREIELQDAKDGLVRLYKEYQRTASNTELSRMIASAMKDNNLKEGDPMTRQFIHDLAQRTTCWYMGLPYSRVFGRRDFPGGSD
ncbi:MAG: HNH endonuclease [Alphaproteobacteria bacterium]|nr:HNH endonuclease [Alphaproteobacteria bacterium]